ncbi:MAG TPA: bifunctional nuclease family protein [Candidatus Sulfomarinibacteraceae bacterium]|jgi:bifunctional DNase/RNase|nr:bifunctional nuclease family protein [Candidatus Sulfomarinibacteraceae bacterium]
MTDTSPSPPVKMTVRALVVDPSSNSPVIILARPEENAYLPIWIGVCEANAIAVSLEGVTTPRPMTHDLMVSLISSLGFTLDHILIHSLAESVFHASLHLVGSDGKSTREVDARPSDAIAIALRAKADVLVDPSVLEQAVVTEATQEEAVKAVLERLRPEDLGDYEM